MMRYHSQQQQISMLGITAFLFEGSKVRARVESSGQRGAPVPGRSAVPEPQAAERGAGDPARSHPAQGPRCWPLPRGRAQQE